MTERWQSPQGVFYALSRAGDVTHYDGGAIGGNFKQMPSRIFFCRDHDGVGHWRCTAEEAAHLAQEDAFKHYVRCKSFTDAYTSDFAAGTS